MLPHNLRQRTGDQLDVGIWQLYKTISRRIAEATAPRPSMAMSSKHNGHGSGN